MKKNDDLDKKILELLAQGYSQTQIAIETGKSNSWISIRIRWMKENGKKWENNKKEEKYKDKGNKDGKSIEIKNKSKYIAEKIIQNENNSNYEININNKKYIVEVPIAGEHFIYNSLCAIAVGKELKIVEEKIIKI